MRLWCKLLKSLILERIAFTLSTFVYYLFMLLSYLTFYKYNLKLNKNDIHITADRESKELSVDLEWILCSISWSKYRLKNDLLRIKTASNNKNIEYLLKGNNPLGCKWLPQICFLLKYKNFFKLAARKFHFRKYKKFLQSMFFFIFRARKNPSWNIRKIWG